MHAFTARGTPDEVRAAVFARLRSRRAEIERVTLIRVNGIADPSEVGDPAYIDGLRAAVSAAIDYGLAGIERREERGPLVPAPLLVQARMAARAGVSLDTVLRRYVAGYTLFDDFLVEEAEGGDLLAGAGLKSMLRTQAALFDRLLAVVGEEYAQEVGKRLRTSEDRRAERVLRLLAGEALDTSDLNYDFDGYHVGLVASGHETAGAIRHLAKSLDCRLLVVQREEAATWAWLGARDRLDPEDLERTALHSWPVELPLAIGECSRGLSGWRLTHQQARAALQVALRRSDSVVRYADVALVASMIQDDLLSNSLRVLYLEPLSAERDGGEALRETLRAYFAAEGNVSSAAAALRVSRRTVANRLRAVESKLGRPLGAAGPDIEAALHLNDLDCRAIDSPGLS